MVSIQHFFQDGMDRTIPELLDPPKEASLPQLNLGPGNIKDIRSAPKGLRPTIGLGPIGDAKTDIGWNAPDPLPFDDESVGAVHAYHFMEHLRGEDALAVLLDVERVLVPGGVMFITTPYPGHGIYWHALDHRSAWNEETWDWLFSNGYYSLVGNREWKLRLHACFMMGIVYRNLSLFTQLVKV